MDKIQISGFFPEDTIAKMPVESEAFFPLSIIFITLKNIIIPISTPISKDIDDFLPDIPFGEVIKDSNGSCTFNFFDYFNDNEVPLVHECYDSLVDHKGFIFLRKESFIVYNVDVHKEKQLKNFYFEDLTLYKTERLEEELKKVMKEEDWENAQKINEELMRRKSDT